MSDFQNLIQKRRSIYHLGNKTNWSEEEITNLIEQCVYNAPSAFNSQSARIVILYGDSYQKFWLMVMDVLSRVVPADKFDATKNKLASFTTGMGTVLFFEDDAVVQALQEKFPLYQDKFPVWSQQSNAILQYMIWTVLAEQNIGASLQHYNPLIDDQTKQMFNIPSTWSLIAQMPFGSIASPADPKEHMPLNERIKIFK